MLLTDLDQLLSSSMSVERLLTPNLDDVGAYRDLLAQTNIVREETEFLNDRAELAFAQVRRQPRMPRHGRADDAGNGGAWNEVGLARVEGNVAAANFATVLAVTLPLLALWEPGRIVRSLFAVACALVVFFLRFGHLRRVKEFMRNLLA